MEASCVSLSNHSNSQSPVKEKWTVTRKFLKKNFEFFSVVRVSHFRFGLYQDVRALDDEGAILGLWYHCLD